MTLEEELAQAIHTCISNPNQRVNSDKAANATKAALSIIEKRIDSEINEIQKSINSFIPECGYAMFNQSQQELVIKVLNHVKEMLKN